MERSVTIVDACLRDGRGGSPTAVMWDGAMSDAERREVPAVAGTSHAVFVSAGDEEVRLRFFTVTGELPACGHGTVAALAFLAGCSGRREYQGTVIAGGRSFAGRATPEGAVFDPGEVSLREATAGERELALDAFGEDPADICVASIGRPRLLASIPAPSALAALSPDPERLRAACDRLGLLGCYAYCAPGGVTRLAARMFAPSIGVPEDIANANSTACLAARLGVGEISVDMGDSLGRPSTITASARRTGTGFEIRVGGSARVGRTLDVPLSRLRKVG
jgi:predicted PhzF superfamily epimerase YddE/YHI9